MEWDSSSERWDMDSGMTRVWGIEYWNGGADVATTGTEYSRIGMGERRRITMTG